MHPTLEQLIAQSPSLQASLPSHIGAGGVAAGIGTGHSALDAYLPWRGWPTGAMTEIMTDTVGCGELSLLSPAMARLSHEKRPILCIGVPHKLFSPALRHAGIDVSRISQINPAPTVKQFAANLWSTEQALKTGLPGMVVLWSPPRSNAAIESLRRLHMACLGRDTMLIHFRTTGCMAQPSPAWLRMSYGVTDTQVRLQVLKCRGQSLAPPLICLDRAEVQPKLFTHLAARLQLNTAVTTGYFAKPKSPLIDRSVTEATQALAVAASLASSADARFTH
jgi:protein ImuA